MDLPKLDITDLNRPYWEALRDGRLTFQRCGCGNAWLPARRECPRCLRDGARWENASGQGRLLSWVVYHTAYHPAFAGRLPYHVALVELDEGPRLLTRVLDGHEALRGDAPVRFEMSWDNDVALPTFRLDPAGTRTTD